MCASCAMIDRDLTKPGYTGQNTKNARKWHSSLLSSNLQVDTHILLARPASYLIALTF